MTRCSKPCTPCAAKARSDLRRRPRPAIDKRQIEEAKAAIQERGAHVSDHYNLLEPMIGEPVFPVARQHEVSMITRVPHSSGLLEGAYSEQTSFRPDDHRSFRVTDDEKRKKWLLDGLKKVERLSFLTQNTGRTLGQAAIKYIWPSHRWPPCCRTSTTNSSLPNLPRCDTPDLTREELARIGELSRSNFGWCDS